MKKFYVFTISIWIMTLIVLSFLIIGSYKYQTEEVFNAVDSVENQFITPTDYELEKIKDEYKIASEIVENEYRYKIADSVLTYSEKYNIPVYIVYAVIFTESGGDYYTRVVDFKAESIKKCRGLMQISKVALNEFNWKTGHHYTFDMMYQIEPNIEVGCWFFAERFKGFYDNWSEAYCLYNAGFTNFTNGNDQPSYKSKQLCRKKVKNAIERFEMFEKIMRQEFNC